ncbi:hypothetical protein CC1G_12524 [Coprinopsis cinerea okayama7|uniref:Uncharacterized protein n=1 Tax=Coprinopsis cinerea (strain Okayama-7 / 130 / ATCC MYA-4618 / FGSC 9003) TaxID=240176 RepID=A8NMW1_COPC7|nr:hypothetical protein CC1G_12524 [Coprinopsis cinerea okayama7\|eukprot:XP_001834999.2 hypothetical protein CC1G_12524 [Coprinopsis cinerea okayama7\
MTSQASALSKFDTPAKLPPPDIQEAINKLTSLLKEAGTWADDDINLKQRLLDLTVLIHDSLRSLQWDQEWIKPAIHTWFTRLGDPALPWDGYARSLDVTFFRSKTFQDLVDKQITQQGKQISQQASPTEPPIEVRVDSQQRVGSYIAYIPTIFASNHKQNRNEKRRTSQKAGEMGPKGSGSPTTSQPTGGTTTNATRPPVTRGHTSKRVWSTNTEEAVNRFRRQQWLDEEEELEDIDTSTVLRALKTLPSRHKPLSDELHADLNAIYTVLQQTMKNDLHKTIREILESKLAGVKGEMEAVIKGAKEGINEVRAHVIGVVERTGKAAEEEIQVQGKNMTYARVLAGDNAPEAEAVRKEREIEARIDRKGRQLVVDGIKGDGKGEALTERDLTTKAEEKGLPEGTKFVAAIRLKNGGVVYKLNSKEGIQML